MKISFIATVYNEEKTIETFIDSLSQQTKKPDEIIITDGGSRDRTVESIKYKVSSIKKKNKNVKFTVLIKNGNRSMGRNEAMKHATGDIIVCSDAGNILDKDWVKNITEPFGNKKVDVVAGYYKGLAKNVFQKCLLPYVFVMPDKINPDNFLPATRSVAFTKSIWQKVGGFNEKLSHNEDYAFAKALQKAHAEIVFRKSALVYWIPRTTFRQSFIMFYRFAYGDGQARIIRPKVVFIFLRYIFVILILISAIMMKSSGLLLALFVLFFLYVIWAVAKNYKYVKEWQAWYFLPLLQFIADWAVLKGTVLGLLNRKITYT